MSAAAQPTLDQIRAAMASTNDLFNVEVVGKRNFDALDRIYTRMPAFFLLEHHWFPVGKRSRVLV
jgi:hypothetical protein